MSASDFPTYVDQTYKYPGTGSADNELSASELSAHVLLSELAKQLPKVRGKNRHPATLWRWALRGFRGVRLETWVYPEGRKSSLAAFKRFVERLTRAADDQAPLPNQTSRQKAQHQLHVESEIVRVRSSIRRKG
jgi:hypothetical protein